MCATTSFMLVAAIASSATTSPRHSAMMLLTRLAMYDPRWYCLIQVLVVGQ
jgi:hypothetical protein